MQYLSTRGRAPVLGFEDAMLAGLARDGGLYLPESWPQISADEIAGFVGMPYAQVAIRVMRDFVGADIGEAEFAGIVEEAYGTFDVAEVAPLVQIAPQSWICELFHGPTLAFKDIAMQLLARLMDRALTRRGKRATVVGATSGDTGGAAVEAFAGTEAIDIFILHPNGRVSDVQRRQMTGAAESNVHNIAVEGTFDDCQALVKALFNDHALRDSLALAGVNSINWARIMAQTVYYFTSAAALGAPAREVGFAVPTGNFGDIFAGYAASRMGLPISRLVIATNENDILARTLASGRYQPKSVVATTSPSMDIQVSSNFERLLFEVSGRSGERVRSMMRELGESGAIELNPTEIQSIRAAFAAHRIDQDEAAETIRQLCQEQDYIADPHTAVGVAAAAREELDPGSAMVALGTAHPAKFPDAVKRACGKTPITPDCLEKRLQAEERYDVLGNDFAVIAEYLTERSRALAEPQL